MTHAEKMVAAIESALEDSPGVLEVEIDGQTTTFESIETMKRVRDEYKREVQRENGTRSTSAQIDLGGSW